jgi:transcriptional regulator with XRE-family HTH domain
MTSEQFKQAIDNLGLSQSSVAILLGVHARTTRRWANAERKVPPPVCSFLHYLVDARVDARPKSANAARGVRRARKAKDYVGPTFVATFADGVVVRMTTFTSLHRLDWERGQRLAYEAYASRVRQTQPQLAMPRLPTLEHLEQYIAARAAPVEVPPIAAAHFEQDGKVLAQREF